MKAPPSDESGAKELNVMRSDGRKVSDRSDRHRSNVARAHTGATVHEIARRRLLSLATSALQPIPRKPLSRLAPVPSGATACPLARGGPVLVHSRSNCDSLSVGLRGTFR